MSLGLLGAYHSSDSSSGSEDETPQEKPTPQTAVAAPKLTNPFLQHSAADTYKPSYMVEAQEFHKSDALKGNPDSSVFSNPFKAREDRKRAVLERHVEMTAKQEDQRTLRGKKICWNFRKGRCSSAASAPSPTTTTWRCPKKMKSLKVVNRCRHLVSFSLELSRSLKVTQTRPPLTTQVLLFHTTRGKGPA